MTLRLLVGAALLLAAPSPAAAHQRQLIQIGPAEYLFVIGSLDEPIHTGDKSGVDLTVLVPDASAPLDSRAAGVKPVEGLEQTLKVEIKAGPHTRVLDLEPAYRNPGHYEALFYPTVATTYTYRIFGTIGGIPVNLAFSCNPTGHVQNEDRTVVRLGADVTRKGIVGTYGCPVSREEAEFPPRK